MVAIRPRLRLRVRGEPALFSQTLGGDWDSAKRLPRPVPSGPQNGARTFRLNYFYLKNAAYLLVSRLGVAVAATLVVILYWPALDSAYRLDDFAWLSLRNTIASGRGIWWALFSPQAQGTIRPLGERLWFLLSSSLFGLNSVPLHVLALCTQIANVFLLADTGRRLTDSRAAGALAAILWVINDALVDPLVWASAYNEVLYTFWMLAAFNAFLRNFEAPKRSWVVVQSIALVLALGTVELAVMFPAIVAAYVILFDKKRWKNILPSSIIAAVYVVIHLWAVALPKEGAYKISWGWGVIQNLLHRWATVLGPEEFGRLHQTNFWMTRLATIAISAAILVWTAISLRSRRREPLFCLAWFVILLIPTLPLQDRFILYYPFLPSIGLAWLAGDALVRAASWPARSIAIACAVMYAACQIPSTIFVRDWDREQSANVVAREAHLLVAVRDIRRMQPSGPVFLTGLDWEQFWWGICYGELTRKGFADLHVLPDANAQAMMIPPKEWCFTPDFQPSREEADRVLRQGRAKIYDVAKLPPVEVTLNSALDVTGPK